MENLPRKVLLALETMGRSQSAAARAVGMQPSQFSRVMNGQGKLTADQLFTLSRYLGVSMEYLADDGLDSDRGGAKTPAEDVLSYDERHVLTVFRDLGLSRAEATRRLSGREASPPDEGRAGSGGAGSQAAK
jgi:transcriptional regulator with XRE-family HTH domain